jgi:hypothetical protein
MLKSWADKCELPEVVSVKTYDMFDSLQKRALQRANLLANDCKILLRFLEYFKEDDDVIDKIHIFEGVQMMCEELSSIVFDVNSVSTSENDTETGSDSEIDEDTEAEEEVVNNDEQEELEEEPPADVGNKVQNDEDDGWSTVVSKNNKKRNIREEIHKDVGELLLKESYSNFAVFSDDFRSKYITYLGHVDGLSEVVSLSKKYRYFHAFCPDTNFIYNFQDGAMSRDPPTERYIKKYDKSVESNYSSRKKFYLFEEQSGWPEWKYVGLFFGIDNVRTEAKKYTYSHTYCLKDNGVIDFQTVTRKNGQQLFTQHVKKNSEYISRFKEWFVENLNDSDPNSM